MPPRLMASGIGFSTCGPGKTPDNNEDSPRRTSSRSSLESWESYNSDSYSSYDSDENNMKSRRLSSTGSTKSNDSNTSKPKPKAVVVLEKFAKGSLPVKANVNKETPKLELDAKNITTTRDIGPIGCVTGLKGGPPPMVRRDSIIRGFVDTSVKVPPPVNRSRTFSELMNKKEPHHAVASPTTPTAPTKASLLATSLDAKPSEVSVAKDNQPLVKSNNTPNIKPLSQAQDRNTAKVTATSTKQSHTNSSTIATASTNKQPQIAQTLLNTGSSIKATNKAPDSKVNPSSEKSTKICDTKDTLPVSQQLPNISKNIALCSQKTNVNTIDSTAKSTGTSKPAKSTTHLSDSFVRPVGTISTGPKVSATNNTSLNARIITSSDPTNNRQSDPVKIAPVTEIPATGTSVIKGPPTTAAVAGSVLVANTQVNPSVSTPTSTPLISKEVAPAVKVPPDNIPAVQNPSSKTQMMKSSKSNAVHVTAISVTAVQPPVTTLIVKPVTNVGSEENPSTIVSPTGIKTPTTVTSVATTGVKQSTPSIHGVKSLTPAAIVSKPHNASIVGTGKPTSVDNTLQSVHPAGSIMTAACNTRPSLSDTSAPNIAKSNEQPILHAPVHAMDTKTSQRPPAQITSSHQSGANPHMTSPNPTQMGSRPSVMGSNKMNVQAHTQVISSNQRGPRPQVQAMNPNQATHRPQHMVMGQTPITPRPRLLAPNPNQSGTPSDVRANVSISTDPKTQPQVVCGSPRSAAPQSPGMGIIQVDTRPQMAVSQNYPTVVGTQPAIAAKTYANVTGNVAPHIRPTRPQCVTQPRQTRPPGVVRPTAAVVSSEPKQVAMAQIQPAAVVRHMSPQILSSQPPNNGNPGGGGKPVPPTTQPQLGISRHPNPLVHNVTRQPTPKMGLRPVNATALSPGKTTQQATVRQPPNQPSSDATASGHSYAAITAKTWQPNQPQPAHVVQTTTPPVSQPNTPVQRYNKASITANKPGFSQLPTQPNVRVPPPVVQNPNIGRPVQGGGQSSANIPAPTSIVSGSAQNQHHQVARLQASHSAVDVSKQEQNRAKPISGSVGELSSGTKDPKDKDKEKECSMM